MKFLIDNWMLITIALASAGMLFLPVLQGAAQSGVDANAAVQLMNREKAVVIDVCEKAEFAQGHIGGAKNIPLSELETKLPTVVKNKNLPLLLVCQTGNRSRGAVAVAKKMGYEKAQSLAGGLKGWATANLPIEKT